MGRTDMVSVKKLLDLPGKDEIKRSTREVLMEFTKALPPCAEIDHDR